MADTTCAAVLALIALFAPSSALAQGAAPNDATREARAIFDDYWQWRLREEPDFATRIGDHRYDDKLADESRTGVDRRRAARATFRDRLAKVDAAQLAPAERVSAQVLGYLLEQAVALDAMCAPLSCYLRDFWAPVTQFYGPQFSLPQLVEATRFATVRDYDAYLARLGAWPVAVDQWIDRMETGMKLGWMPPKVAIARAPSQLDGQTDPDPKKSPEYAPFRSFPADIATAERERLAAAGERVIRDAVIPSFQKLRTFYVERYLPAASERIAASDLPPGLPYYDLRVRSFTTTRMSPREIHELGLREVARIGKAMDDVMKEVGFIGTRADFQKTLNTDPRFFHTDREAMLAGYRDIAKRADAKLPELFAELPRQTYGIRAMRPEEGDNAEHYVPGAADGTRAGYFEANVNTLSRRPRWTMETLLLHEAVPGHHLQTARAQEMTGLPDFRRNTWFVAYGEGWALYAESLGYEMGFYTDPYSKFGNLASEMHRAARLVVDTGLHALGWTRARAIAYLEETAALTPAFAEAEVDRYLVWPGQATAYKIGELKIKALRAKAKAALGERFDLRRFHNALIDNGAVPLDVLDTLIDEWIVAERARAP